MRRQFHQRAFRTRTSLKRLEKRLISRSKRHCDEPSFFFRGVQHGPPFTYYLQFQLYSTLLLQAPPHRKVRNWISVENSIEFLDALRIQGPARVERTLSRKRRKGAFACSHQVLLRAAGVVSKNLGQIPRDAMLDKRDRSLPVWSDTLSRI